MAWRRGDRWPHAAWSAILLALLLLTGCAPFQTGARADGQVRLVWRSPRQAQYLASEIRTLRVSVAGLDATAAYQQTVSRPLLTGGGFPFSVVNLPRGRYAASVEGFADDAATVSVGRSTSDPFMVVPGTEVAIAMPPLVLAATPVGDWRVQISLTLGPGYALSDCQFTLGTTNGATQATTVRTSTVTWGDVPAFPTGASTTSVVVTAKKGKASVTRSAVVQAIVQAGATVSSTIAMTLP